jgi:hypothetical protein
MASFRKSLSVHFSQKAGSRIRMPPMFQAEIITCALRRAQDMPSFLDQLRDRQRRERHIGRLLSQGQEGSIL